MNVRESVYDVFLSYSARDKATVHALAERLKADGLRVWLDAWEIRPGDSIPAKIEEGLESSRVLVLCMSANALGSDWTALESQTFRFRDPLNKDCRFIPVRMDDAEPRGSLAQFSYIDWRNKEQDGEYRRLLEACKRPKQPSTDELDVSRFEEKIGSLGHTYLIRSVALSTDGKRALSGSLDSTLRLWDVESGRTLRVFEGHDGSVLSVAFSTDGKRALSGSDDKTLRLWDVESGRAIRVFEGHTDCVWSVAFSADGKRALSGSRDNTLRLWDVELGRTVRVFERHADCVLSVAMSADGKRALSGALDKTIRLLDVESGRTLRVFKGHTGSIWSVAFSADGKRVLSGSVDKTLRLWDVQSGRTLRVLEGHIDIVFSVAFSADGRRALSGSEDKTLRLWDVETGSALRVFKDHINRAWSVAFSVDWKRALSGSEDQTLRLWDVETGSALRVFKGHTDSVLSVAFSSDGKRALSGSHDKTLRLWDVESGRTLRVFNWHTSSVLSVAFNSDGKRAISGSDDKTLRLWDMESGRALGIFEGHTDSVWSVAFSANGKRALSGSGDKTLRLWDVESGHALRIFEGHTDSVLSVALSADGKRALSGSNDNTLRLWDVQSGRPLRVFEGHSGSVLSVALSADGKRALSGSEDKTLRLWDVESGRALRVFEGHTDSVRSVAFSADGKHGFSAANNGVWRSWNLTEIGESVIHRGGEAASAVDEVQYTNAKVLLVGDSGVGKTGLARYLALKIKDEESNSSTNGAWATQWTLPHTQTEDGVEREIWLWDFAGQVDYRLVHQLFMDETAAAVLVFNPQNENPFEGLGQWDRDITKAMRKPFAKLLAAGRVDCGGLVVSQASMNKFMDERGFVGGLHETSAKTGEGCDKLRETIIKAIDWQNIPKTTSQALYHRMKQEVLKLRDGGPVLIRWDALKQSMEMALLAERFKFEELETVVSLLSGPGMIQKVDFGGFILLRPEVLSRYAAALVRKVRKHPQELGCINEEEMLSGKLDYQDFDRLPEEQEAVVLRTLHETLVSRAYCLRQVTDGKTLLTFPSYFRRERPELPGHPTVLVTYRFSGPADDIYATLVVRLHHTEAFETDQLWRFAADFKTQTGKSLGLKMTREAEGAARLELYFNPDVDENSRVLFARYVHNHLTEHAKEVKRLRHYACGNKKCKVFTQPFANQSAIDDALNSG